MAWRWAGPKTAPRPLPGGWTRSASRTWCAPPTGSRRSTTTRRRRRASTWWARRTAQEPQARGRRPWFSISPATGVRGATVPVTLTGTNFVAGATVAADNPGITVSGVAVLSGSQMAATFTIGTGASLGVSNVTVTTSGGASGAVAFTVSAPPATITATGGTPQSVGFYSAFAPLVATVTDASANPVPGALVTFQAPGDGSGCWFQTVGASEWMSRVRTATAGPRPRSIAPPNYSATATTDANGAASSPPCVAQSTAGDFTVLATVSGVASPAVFHLTNVYPAPRLTSVTPASGAQGTSVGVTLTGSLFAPGATVAVGNPAIAVSGVTVVNDMAITAPSPLLPMRRPGRRMSR